MSRKVYSGHAPKVNTLLNAALRYAERGWPVFPCHSILPDGTCTCRGRAKKCKPGKHPRIYEWQSKATADPATIRRWWREWPSANIAVALGPPRLVVLDLDCHDNGADGAATLRGLVAEHGLLPETLAASSPSGGCHFYYSGEANSVRNLFPDRGGIDRKAALGYTLLPPSSGAGGAYRWRNDLPVAPCPEWFLTAERPKKERPKGDGVGCASPVVDDNPLRGMRRAAGLGKKLAEMRDGRYFGVYHKAWAAARAGLPRIYVEPELLAACRVNGATDRYSEEALTDQIDAGYAAGGAQ